MNSTFEKNNTQPTMAELQAMQKTALNRNIDKAGNIQKAVTLTEENWTGLTGAVELTGQAVLKLQETMEQLPSGEQMDSMLKAQVQLMMAEHMTAISEMQKAVRELNESNARHWTQVQNSVTASLNTMRQEQTETLKKFEKQVGRASEKYSSELSEVTTSMKHSANLLQWQLYLPTILLVLWELVRHLFLLD